MKRKYVTQASFDFNALTFEVNNKPSKTVPSQTLSIQQILERHTRGQGMGVPVKDGVYNDDQYIPNPKALDLAEAEELQDTLKENQQAMIEEFEKRKNQKIADAKELEELRKKELEKTPIEKAAEAPKS